MARNPKLEVAALNVRIPEDKERDYDALINAIVNLKRGVRVYGDTYVALSWYDVDERVGIISKYTEIDLEGEWFDIEEFDTAAPDKIDEINILAP